MKPIKNTKNYLRNILLPLFAFMLVLSTVLPSVASAAETIIGVKLESVGPITETAIQGGTEIKLKLSDSGRAWAHDISSKKELLIDGMTADINTNEWDAYKTLIKSGASLAVDSNDESILIITLPAAAYEISQNETITMNLSPALIENWPGQVTSVTFPIYADPQLSMGGSVMPSVTAEEIQKGGKEIELKLVNATWNKEEFYTMTGLKTFLGRFDNTVINISESVNLSNPNEVIDFPDPQTLRIKLPAIPYTGTGGDVTFTFGPTLAATYVEIDDIDGFSLGNNIIEVSPMLFKITPSTASNLSINPSLITEADIKASTPTTITLTLTGAAKWDGDATNPLSKEKKEALIDALVAENQPEQWLKVKSALRSTHVISVSDTVVEIVIPQVNDYYLTANQKITLEVPHQLLVDDVDLNPVHFEIKATPKALISGTVTPEVSQAEIVKGGKTIVVTLVNSKWEDDIATNTAKREKLLNGFNWGTTNTAEIIKSRANVVRTNNEVVTITLPPIPGFKIENDLSVTFNQVQASTTAPLDNINPLPEAFKVTPVENQSATISGTILSNTNEFDIVKGDKVIIITLKNDIWTKDLTKLDIFKSSFIAKGNIPVTLTAKEVQRTSDTVLTVTLNGATGFTLADDTTVKLDIPAELLSISSKPIETSAFKIAAVKAELPNKANLVLDKSDIQKGGKTITITLKNATFKDNLTNNEIISIFKGGSTDWTKIKNAISNDSNAIKSSKDKITIKLPPVPGYNSDTGETINLKISADLINHENPREITVDGIITIGAVATATLNGSSFTNQQIKDGNATITITLTGGIEWDPTIETNKSKKSALLKGFTVSDQTKEWSLLSKEISANAQFELNNAKNALKITFPAVPDYSIIRNQVVDIKIPKSVLASYKDDIEVANKLTITVPRGTVSDKSLGDLTAEELAKAIEDNKRVIVPAKVVETIFVNTVELPEKQSITTIEITTTSAVEQVQVTVAGGTAQTVEPKGNKSVFVYTNLEKNSELKVSVFGSDKSKPLQSDIYKKIGKGSKTYSEIPKKDLTGSYSIYTLLTDKSLLKDIFKHYSIDELKVTQ